MLANPNQRPSTEVAEKRHGGYLENPSVPLSEGASDDFLGYGRRTTSGLRVTPQMLLKVAALWQGVSMISGDVAKIPLEIYRRAQGNDDRQVENKHPAYRIVRRRPNRKQSAYQMRRQLILHALIWGNAYAIIERNGAGEVIGLLPLLPDRTCCQESYSNDPYARTIYQSEIDGRMEYFDEHDIYHLQGISFDGKEGLELFLYARDTIGKILARENFSSKFFKHGGRVGGTLQLKNVKDKQARDRKESEFRKLYEDPDAAFKTVVLRDWAQFHAAQASFADTQMVEIEQNDVRTVARLLNMPPHKLGAQGTTSYSSLEQENQAYYDNCLSHWLTEIESESHLKLFSEPEQRDNELYFEHTVGALLWADSKTVSAIATNGVRGGWLRPNEARKWFNLPRDPDGDNLYIPSGMVVPGEDPDDGDPEDDPAAGLDIDPEDDGDEVDETDDQ